jgi:hypothetical protein
MCIMLSHVERVSVSLRSAFYYPSSLIGSWVGSVALNSSAPLSCALLSIGQAFSPVKADKGNLAFQRAVPGASQVERV